MEKDVAKNLFYLEQCKMLYYFAGNYQLDLTNINYCEFTNFPFFSEEESMSMSYRKSFMCSV